MSKIKLLSAIMLIAFVLGLSACGGNKDAGSTPDATPTQSGVKQSYSEAKETTSSVAGEDTASSGDTNSKEKSKDESKQQSAVSADTDTSTDERADAPERAEDPAAQKSGNNTGSQKAEQSGSNSSSRAAEKDEQQKAGSKAESPDTPSSRGSGDRDNAEVSINDL